MKATDLRDELHKRKKSMKGKKDELMQWLINFENLPPDESAGGDQQIDQQPAGFHHRAKWRVLEQDKTKWVSNLNEIPSVMGLTVPKGGEEWEEFDFSDNFDCNPFMVMSKEYEWNSKGQVKMGKDGKPKMSEERIHTQGWPNLRGWRNTNLPVIPTQLNGFKHSYPTPRKKRIHQTYFVTMIGQHIWTYKLSLLMQVAEFMMPLLPSPL